eukprot:977555_1
MECADDSNVTIQHSIFVHNQNNTYLCHCYGSNATLINTTTYSTAWPTATPTTAPTATPTTAPTASPTTTPTRAVWSPWVQDTLPVGYEWIHYDTTLLALDDGYKSHITEICIQYWSNIEAIKVRWRTGTWSGYVGEGSELSVEWCYALVDPNDCFSGIRIWNVDGWIFAAMQFQIQSTGAWTTKQGGSRGDLITINPIYPNDCIKALQIKRTNIDSIWTMRAYYGPFVSKNSTTSTAPSMSSIPPTQVTSIPTVSPTPIPTVSPTPIPTTVRNLSTLDQSDGWFAFVDCDLSIDLTTSLNNLISFGHISNYTHPNILYAHDFTPTTILSNIIIDFDFDANDDRILFMPCNPFDSENIERTDFDNITHLVSAKHVFNAPAAWYDEILICERDPICSIECTDLLACFGSTFVVNQTSAIIDTFVLKCTSSASCQDVIIHINGSVTAAILCDESFACKQMTVVANQNQEFYFECLTTGSCVDAAIYITNTSKAMIKCYGVESCNGLVVWSDTNDVEIFLYSFSADVAIHVPSQFEKD